MRSVTGRFFPSLVVLACSTVLCGLRLSAQAPQPADLILHNGKILTVDANFSTAEAVALRGQRIAAVGRNADVLKLSGPRTVAIDLKGKTVTPGLIDTHMHIHNYAEEAYGSNLGPTDLHRYPVDWRGVNSKEDVLNQVRSTMEKYRFPPGQWIYFENQVMFRRGQGFDIVKILYDDLNRYELDKLTPNNPIVMSLGIPDFNGFLLNSRAIKILWDDLHYADFIKKYGRYWVDKSGQPEGHIEPPASRLVLRFLLDRSPEVLAPLYRKYLDELNAMGLTTVSTRLPNESLHAFQLLESQGQMTLRLGYGMEEVFGPLTDLKNGMKQYSNLAGKGNDFLWVTSVAPTAVDGGGTRACTNEHRKGTLEAIDTYWPTGQCHTDNEFRGAAGKAASISGNYYREWTMESGLNNVRFANTHVAGDRSVSTLLDVAEQIQKQKGPAATRGWAFDHCRYVSPADFPRAARLGITFSCAPKYINDSPNVAKAFDEKMANTFIVPVKSMMDAGVKVVYESDRDDYSWAELQLYLTRKTRDGKVWGPQERVDRKTALQMITRWAAEYALKGDQLGSIEPGKLADLVVLDRDYMTIPAEEVGQIRPRMTVLDGKIVYLHPAFAQEHNLKPAGAVIASYEDLTKRRTSTVRQDF